MSIFQKPYFFLLVLFEGDSCKAIGLFVCIFKASYLCLISKKPNVLKLPFKICHPLLGAPRGGQIFFALSQIWPPRFISVYPCRHNAKNEPNAFYCRNQPKTLNILYFYKQGYGRKCCIGQINCSIKLKSPRNVF